MSRITKTPEGLLVAEGVTILPGTYRNFAGLPDQFNPGGGKRYFNFVIDDPEAAQEMKNDGWNVKIKPPREEGDTPFCYLKVAVAFPKPGSRARDLDIAMFKSSGVNKLDESTIGLLDRAYITKANIVVRPYNWDQNDPNKKAAYVQELHAYVQEESHFSADYDDFADENPFDE